MNRLRTAGVLTVVVLGAALGLYLFVLRSPSGTVVNCSSYPSPQDKQSCDNSATSSIHAFSIIAYGAFPCVPLGPGSSSASPCGPGVAIGIWNGLDSNVTITSMSFDGAPLTLYPFRTEASIGCHCAEFGDATWGTTTTTFPLETRSLSVFPSNVCVTGTHSLTLDTNVGSFTYSLALPATCPPSPFA